MTGQKNLCAMIPLELHQQVTEAKELAGQTTSEYISWSEVLPGDLAFYPGDSHVGIACGFDESGNVQIIHCASGANNVVVTGKSGFTTVGRPNYYSE